MTNDAPKPSRFDYDDDDTIASVYEGSTGKASVRMWIHSHRNESTEDLYLSDSPEGRFRLAIDDNSGLQISRRQVRARDHHIWESILGQVNRAGQRTRGAKSKTVGMFRTSVFCMFYKAKVRQFYK